MCSVVQRVEVRGDCFFDDNREIVDHHYKAFVHDVRIH